MRNAVKKIYIIISRAFFCLFYDKKYLRGKWFDNNVYGWNRCWQFFFAQKIKGYNRKFPFPVCPFSTFGRPENISFSVENMDNFWKSGCYYQSWEGKIHVGEGA